MNQQIQKRAERIAKAWCNAAIYTLREPDEETGKRASFKDDVQTLFVHVMEGLNLPALLQAEVERDELKKVNAELTAELDRLKSGHE